MPTTSRKSKGDTKSTKPNMVIVSAQSMLRLEAIAMQYFHEDLVVIRPRMLFKALYHYMVEQGVQPNFEVDIKDTDYRVKA